MQIFKNIFSKSKTSLLIYNSIVYKKAPSLPIRLQKNHILPKLSKLKLLSKIQLRFYQVSRSLLYYDISINKDIQILIINLIMVLSISNLRRHNKTYKTDSLVCLTNQLK